MITLMTLDRIVAMSKNTYDLLRSMEQRRQEKRSALQAEREAQQHQEDQRWTLDLALMGTRLGLDEALRHPTLSPDGSGSLRSLNGERLTVLSQEVLELTDDQVQLDEPSRVRHVADQVRQRLDPDVDVRRDATADRLETTAARLDALAAQLDARQKVEDLVRRYVDADMAVREWRAAEAALSRPIEAPVRSPGDEFARRVDQVRQASAAYDRAWTGLVEAARSNDAALSALEDWDRRRGRDSLPEATWKDVRLAEPLTWTPGQRWMEHQRGAPAGPTHDPVRFDYAKEPAEVELAWRAALACTAPDRGLYASTPELAERIDRRWGEAFLPDHPPLCDELKLKVLSANTDRSPEVEQLQKELQQNAGGLERAEQRAGEISDRALAARLGSDVRRLQDLDRRQLAELQDQALREMQRLSRSRGGAEDDAAWDAANHVYQQARQQEREWLRQRGQLADDQDQGRGPDQGPGQRRT